MSDLVVTEATLLPNVDEADYHAGRVRTPGPQVSQSGLKMLRPPSTPREFQHYLLHGLKPSRALDRGTCAHTIALGRGQDFVRHPDELLTTNGAMNVRNESKAWITEAKAKGQIVLKGEDHDAVFGMAAEILAHPRAGELFTDPHGLPEVSAFFPAAEGLWMRARFDLLRDDLVDLKTSVRPHPDAWRSQAWDLGYPVQDAAYRRAYAEATGSPDPGPLTFVVVGAKPPHLVGVYQLDPEMERFGREQLDAALTLYAEQYAKHGNPRDPGVRWDGLPIETAMLAPPRRAYYDDAEGVDYEPEF